MSYERLNLKNGQGLNETHIAHIEDGIENLEQNKLDSSEYGPVTDTAAGNPITLADSLKMKLRGLKLYGKTTQNGTPTPDAPVPLVSAGGGGKMTVTAGDSSMDISTPNGLPGLPVTSGGNYTDETGQQWICDEMDFGRGVYVQRIKSMHAEEIINFDMSLVGINDHGIANFALYTGFTDISESGIKAGLCNLLPKQNTFMANTTTEGFLFERHLYIRLNSSRASTESEFKEWVNSNDLHVQYVLETPVETALSAEELALYTNYPNTTILNDAGAGMEVKYVADTKLYIDKKFAELASAMINQ